MYLKSCKVLQDTIPNKQVYPFNIPSLQDLHELEFPTNVTFFVGENGSGNQHYLRRLRIAAISIRRVVVAKIYMKYIRRNLRWGIYSFVVATENIEWFFFDRKHFINLPVILIC